MSQALKAEDIVSLAYWNIRATLETAKSSLESPHPLWGFLNELREDIDRMEKLLDVPNRMDD
jgi:hypothetical protein